MRNFDFRRCHFCTDFNLNPQSEFIDTLIEFLNYFEEAFHELEVFLRLNCLQKDMVTNISPPIINVLDPFEEPSPLSPKTSSLFESWFKMFSKLATLSRIPQNDLQGSTKTKSYERKSFHTNRPWFYTRNLTHKGRIFHERKERGYSGYRLFDCMRKRLTIIVIRYNEQLQLLRFKFGITRQWNCRTNKFFFGAKNVLFPLNCYLKSLSKL